MTDWIAKLSGSEDFLAAPVASVVGVLNQGKGKSHGIEIAFIRVPISSLSLSRPENWSALIEADGLPF